MWLTVTQLAQIQNKTERAVRKAIASGKYATARYAENASPRGGRAWKISVSDRALNLVVVHAGWDAIYRDEMHASVEMTLNVVKNFPGLKLVAAHMGGLRLARDVFDRLAGKHDLYFDTTYTADPWLDKGMFRDIIRRHGAERVLFGSDYPWHLPSAEIGLIKSLDIGEEEKKMILGENAARLLGL